MVRTVSICTSSNSGKISKKADGPDPGPAEQDAAPMW
jgi:hypothetical protein